LNPINKKEDVKMNLKQQIQNYKPYNKQEEKDKEQMLKHIDTFTDVLTRENTKCHFTASNWIVNKERTKVIMAYHNIYKSWAWTGGHSDGDSDLLNVALKEAKEETGLENLKVLSDGIFGIEILPVNRHIKRGKIVEEHLHLDCCFLLEADESEPLRIKEDENSGVKWIDIGKVIETSTEKVMKPIYQKLNEKLMGMKIE
jgi:hydrolase, NUDIX family